MSRCKYLQMTRRERWEKLPLQAHFYPMPTMAYIEDESARVTVASKQPLGVASLNSGQLEIMLDRRLSQDDNRGLGQGVLDNVSPTLNSFRILVEPRINSCKVRFFWISDRGLVLCIRDLFFCLPATGCKESTGWISFFGCP